MKQIETKRAKLRRLKLSDFENMRELESNPLIMKFTPSKVPQTEEQTRNRLHGQIAKQSDYEPFGIWAAELKEDLSFIGWFMLMPVKENQLELGFMLVEKYWAKGLATEVCMALLDFAKSCDQIKKIIAKTTSDNEMSKKVLEKLKFTSVQSDAVSALDRQINFFEIAL